MNQSAASVPPSALNEVPESSREVVRRIIEKPMFLKRLLIEEAERLEEYSEHPASLTKLSLNCDAWGNYVTVSEDCIGQAKYYRRVAQSLVLPNK